MYFATVETTDPESTRIAVRRSGMLIRVRQAVRHVEELSCCVPYLLGKKNVFLTGITLVVILCGLGMQSPRMSSRETEGSHLSQRSVSLSLFWWQNARYDASHNWVYFTSRTKLF